MSIKNDAVNVLYFRYHILPLLPMTLLSGLHLSTLRGMIYQNGSKMLRYDNAIIEDFKKLK